MHGASEIWFASLVALLVGLGAQLLLESVLPASVSVLFGPETPGGEHWFRAGDASLWGVSSLVRLASYTLGGLVGVLLARGASGQLLTILLVLAVLETIFEQFPRTGSFMLIAVWSLAAPAGMALGAWLANARGRVA